MIKKKLNSLFFLFTVFITFSSCFKEMPEKGLKITIPENNPVQSLQNLLRDEEKTKILLFGVPSLSVLREDFNYSLLDSIIVKLNSFNPDVICLDLVSPAELLSSALTDKNFQTEELSKSDIEISLKLREKIKSDYRSIDDKIDSLINLLQKTPKDEVKIRRQLIEFLFANLDYQNAAYHFSLIKDKEIKSLNLDKKIVNKLNSILKQSDEKAYIAQKLAEKLNLQKIYSIGDLSDKIFLEKISEKLYNEMILSDIYVSWKYENSSNEVDKKLKEGLSKNNLYDFLHYLNTDLYALKSTKKNWSIYYKMFLESKLDRTRIGLWEMKNLRIAANIREISSLYPTKKILVIIDVSKKPFIEEYLKANTDIKVLKFTEI